jgi:2-amino-4-hydroxy-6-hydroxymethyldihydropteridine diphosphokinase
MTFFSHQRLFHNYFSGPWRSRPTSKYVCQLVYYRMHRVFLLTGTNKGDCLKNLRQAEALISGYAGKITKKSAIYRTAAWGKTDQREFLNQVLELHTLCSPADLLDAIQKIEISMGRKRAEKWGERVIDIDILFFEGVIISSPTLTIPHPEIQNRRFTLVPLQEIAPELMHPVTGKNISQLLEECADTLDVEKTDLEA